MCFRVKSCCGCNSLEKGCRIIAIMGMVSGVMGAVQAAIRMDFGSVFADLIGIGFRYDTYQLIGI